MNNFYFDFWNKVSKPAIFAPITHLSWPYAKTHFLYFLRLFQRSELNPSIEWGIFYARTIFRPGSAR